MLTKEKRAELKSQAIRAAGGPDDCQISPLLVGLLLDALDQAERKMLNYARKADRLEQDLMNCRMEAEQCIAELEAESGRLRVDAKAHRATKERIRKSM